jgi:hypothetical protein
MVAVAISGLVLTVAYQLLGLGLGAAGRVGRTTESMDALTGTVASVAAEARYARSIEEPIGAGASSVLELTHLETGAWRISRQDGAVILEEKLGFERRVLARGVDALWFQRDPENARLLYITVGFGPPDGRRTYRTAVYLRGLRVREEP